MVDIEQKKQYIRHGECTACGECCKHLHPDEDWSPGMTGTRCNALQEDNLCSLHPDKPAPCLEWPATPNDLIYQKVKDKCTYWFEEVKE